MLGHRTLNAEDYLTILKRRWWIVCIPAVIVPVICVAATYFVTPRYDSVSLILIDQQKVSSDVVKPMDIGDLQGRLGLMTARIESRSTLEPIINKYNLYGSQHLSMEERVSLVRDKNLHVAPIESQIDRANGMPGFKVTFTADDPRTAQEVCAEITGLYTKNNLDDLQNRTVGTTEFVQSELNESKRKLDDMDQKLAEFKSKNLGALPGDEGSTTTLLGSLSSRLDAISNEMQQLQQTKQIDQTFLDQATKASTPAGVSAKTEAADEIELDKARTNLAELQLHYSDEYPDVKAAKRRVADLEAQIAKAAANPAPVVAAPKSDSMDVVRLKAAIQAIDGRIALDTKEQAQINAQMRTAQGRISASPVVDQQYTELTRDYTTEQANYNKLLAEFDQSQATTEMQNRQEGESFSMLDAASLPIDPTFPKQSVFALGGVAGGIGLGILIIAFLEYRDTALRSERDIWAFTQLPTLAVIAYSDSVSEVQHTEKPGFLRRLFSRKPKEALAG